MQVLVTGATGLIGNSLARKLVERRHDVRALVRDPERARRLLPKEVELAKGDITAPDSLKGAMAGVTLAFHAAGMPEQWQRDERIFDQVNRQGTANVMQAALSEGVDRVVYTSTMDVFEAERGGTLVETKLDPNPKHTAYERSKQQAEAEAEKARKEGLEVVYLNPAAVYGPSPVHVGLNSYFIRVMNREVPILPPGGTSIAYVDNVVDGHVAAAESGKSGERYLLADAYVSMADLAKEIIGQSGLTRVPPQAPAWLVTAMAYALAPPARLFGFKPLVAPNEVTFMLWQARVDARKAQKQLHYQPTPMEEGVKRTIAFLRAQGLVKA